MTTDLDSLRKRIGKLYADRTIGDVTEKVFQRQIAERTVELYRAVVKGKLAEGEDIVAEHHAVSSHFRLTKSVLREPDQHATSLFLTNLRLLQLKSTIFPGRPPTADRRDGTAIGSIRLDRIKELKFRRQVRVGEACVGAVMCTSGVLFSAQLALTGPVMIGLGALGILHAALRPTTWIEIRASNGTRDADPIIIHAVRKKSARKLFRLLQERVSKG